MRWSETGDRYIVSLFRDYVFHQVDEAGNPVVNLTHVITCLNKVRVLVRPNMVVFIDPSRLDDIRLEHLWEFGSRW